MVLDSDGKTYLTLDPTGKPQTTAYQCFSLQILRTFKPNAQSSMSLDNWTYLQTKQNPELKNFLSEFGFKQLSDWALLNRTRSKQLQQLAERDRHLIAAFHAVYRQDRHQQHQGTKPCLDPTIGATSRDGDLFKSTKYHNSAQPIDHRNCEEWHYNLDNLTFGAIENR
ncbi:MAG UNVERIFIED_CONTAM: hypothetical protein LVR29_23625 [Microcystis novacekii LVE1205-3]|jgi:hypothetical protein